MMLFGSDLTDLIAVLCPFGPLRILVESSRTQQQEVPALLYSVNAVWFMATPPNYFRLSPSLHHTMTAPHPEFNSFSGSGSGTDTGTGNGTRSRSPSPPTPALTIDTSNTFATAQAQERWAHSNTLPTTDGHGMVVVEADRAAANGFVRLREGSVVSVPMTPRVAAEPSTMGASGVESQGIEGDGDDEEDEEDG
ncbi:hypothetical protein BC936DRAFT_142815, partial [Jimgerdemannia flammicorona]